MTLEVFHYGINRWEDKSEELVGERGDKSEELVGERGTFLSRCES
ncbi:hypothetical protein COLO4_02340 [Corchorus olitorius]|uniref:Uncharacterized protein n=1 Tax=Corchorus olitorius TaxID=93759 RepID=A0A1R3L141_9ROSI|nr:hypothetical protein COLO4_02340 [Corchorus olitorius]